MIEFPTYLPYNHYFMNEKCLNTIPSAYPKNDEFGYKPLTWLSEDFKGKYRMADAPDIKCSIIYFEEKEDMQFFVLLWGEYLRSENDLPNL